MGPPALSGSAALINFVDIGAEHEVDFNDWYTFEHLPERVDVPGFLRGRRFVATSAVAPPLGRYLTMYETRDLGVLTSAPYLARLNEPTPWTVRTVGRLSHFVRLACRVTVSRGHGTAGNVATALFEPPTDGGDAIREWIVTAVLDGLVAEHDVVAAHLMESDEEVARAKDATAEGAASTERTSTQWLLVAEASSRARVDALQERLSGPGGLSSQGVAGWSFATYSLMVDLRSTD